MTRDQLPIISADDDPDWWAEVAVAGIILVITETDLSDTEACRRALMANNVEAGVAIAILPAAVRHAHRHMRETAI